MATQSEAGPSKGLMAAAIPSASPSERLKWRRTSTPSAEGQVEDVATWTRDASGIESFLHYHNIERNHEHNAHLPVVIQLRKPIDTDELHRRITRAWTQLFLTVPAVSVTLRSPQSYERKKRSARDDQEAARMTDSKSRPLRTDGFSPEEQHKGPLGWVTNRISSSFAWFATSAFASSLILWYLTGKAEAHRKKAEPDDGVTVHYKSSATKSDLDRWLDDTLAFREMLNVPAQSSEDASDEAEEVKATMDNLTSGFIAEGIAIGSTGSLRLEVILFRQGYVGLGLRFHHAVYDGTAMYVLLDELLTRLQATAVSPSAEALEFPIEKPRPEAHVSQSMPAWVYDSDYASNLRSTIGQTIEVALSPPLISRRKVGPTGRVLQVQHRFSKDETLSLLKAAKAQNATISQIAGVCHLVPLVKRRAPRPQAEDKIYHQTTVDVRSALGLSKRYLGNACVMPDLAVPASSILPRKAWPDATLDRQAILKAAQHNGKELEMQKSNGGWLLAFLEFSLRLLLDCDYTSLPASHITDLASDGILERHFRSQYNSSDGNDDALDFDVRFAAIRMSVQNSIMVARTFSFNDRLVLTLDYNNDAYTRDEVQSCMAEWVEALRYTLLDNDSETQSQ